MEALRDLRESIDAITDREIDGAALALTVLTCRADTEDARQRAVDDAMLRHGVVGAPYAARVRAKILEVLSHAT